MFAIVFSLLSGIDPRVQPRHAASVRVVVVVRTERLAAHMIGLLGGDAGKPIRDRREAAA